MSRWVWGGLAPQPPRMLLEPKEKPRALVAASQPLGPGSIELRRAGAAVPITPKPLHLLRYLLQNADRVRLLHRLTPCVSGAR